MFKVKKNRIILFLSLFILYSQSLLILDFAPIIDVFFSGLRVIIFLCLIFLFYSKHLKLSSFELLLLLYAIVVGAISMLYSEQKTIFILQFFSITSLYILLKCYNKFYFLKYSVIILSAYVYLNFIFTLLSPNAHFYVNGRAMFLLGGNYNSMGPTLLAAIITNAIYSYSVNAMKLNLIMVSICSFLTVVLVGSMTSAVGIGLVVFFIIFFRNLVTAKMLFLFFVGILSFNFVLIYMQVEIDNNYFSWFIESVLGKDLTFSSRVYVWLRAVNLIVESPWWGYGIQPSSWFDYHLNVLTAHNFILTMLLKGGIILMVIFIYILYIAVKEANKYRTIAVNILHFGCCSFLLMMTMESYSMFLVFYFIFLNYFNPSRYVCSFQRH